MSYKIVTNYLKIWLWDEFMTGRLRRSIYLIRRGKFLSQVRSEVRFAYHHYVTSV